MKDRKAAARLALVLTIFSVCILTPCLSKAQRLDDAKAALNRGDHTTTLDILGKLVEMNDPAAQTFLAGLHFTGNGIPKNEREARRWYRLAAEKGFPPAQRLFAYMLSSTHGGEKDLKQAAYWYRKAAEQGDADSQVSLSRMYEKGDGVTQDNFEAAVLLRRAANQGNENAQGALGSKYFYGIGVPQDYVLAYMWLNLALSHPLPSPEIMGGWMRGFAAGNQTMLLELRNKLATMMTAGQIAEAQQLAREWKAKPERP